MRDKLYTEARNMTIDKLPAFMEKLKQYNYGYGSCCIALAAGALATAWAFSTEFGITGFQASLSMWEFIKNWCYIGNRCGLKIVDYDDMLYPQYDYKFEKTISPEVWEAMQKEAKKELKRGAAAYRVTEHWKSICNGNVPFGYTVKED